ncbi:3-hydroxyacyl-CoA dehydrogenase NAD-binding domain-containing protein, partial [uncultured Fusobacterium sp.]|uniref:3-hydroxyacyl-CoA dehydrogenase NAD-binding domain-containing protein n=1 Tax=uncultured Fusobacterium sp. TaxID=159267 RepID=UPI0025CDCA14
MKVGIIGAGTMGSGIAQAFAQTEGYSVALCDINEEFAAKGKAKIAKGFEKRVAKGKMEQAAADAILAKITTGTKEICGDCDLIIEAAIENMAIKKQTFKELQAICKADAMFATNTSSLSITEIGAGLDRPVIGMHFFNPAPVMKLVEVIAGLNTPAEMVEKVKAIGDKIADKKNVYFEIGAGSGLYTFGNGAFLNELIETVGAKNIFGNESSWITVTPEAV